MKLRWWNKIQVKSEERKEKSDSLKLKTFSFSLSFFSFLFSLFSLSCSPSKPAWEYMPDMANQPALKAQRYEPNLPHHRSLLTPVPGTIARDYQPYPYKEDPEGAGAHLQNPLPRTIEVLTAGEKSYKTYCVVCHGPAGLGNGSVVPPFPRPPSLHSEKVRTWSDGRIYHVITMGQNLMPAYASQIQPESRWAVIYYIRALQRAEGATAEDVEAYKEKREKRKEKNDNEK